MEPNEQRRKLAQIARLPAQELAEWYRCLTGKSELYRREPFPGELAAVMERAQRLGVALPSH